MNKVLEQIVSIVERGIAEHLPNVTPNDLEGSGQLFYMNGRNGTEFEWFVNEHLPAFMVFYDDEANLGAVKVLVYDDGTLLAYFYSDQGTTLAGEARASLDADEGELLNLAVALRTNADDKRVWDAPVTEIGTDAVPSQEEVDAFLDLRQYLEPSIRRRQLLGKFAVVSKRITEGSWKVGYMSRGLPHDEDDSGWELYAGNEEDDYSEHVVDIFVLCELGSVAQLDPAIMGYLDADPGTKLVRMTSDVFEPDHGQDPFLEKWQA